MNYKEPSSSHGILDENGENCRRCGTCCVAPDISTLGKPIGVPCSYLGNGGVCTVYQIRPDVCRNYLPDEICVQIAAPTLEERTANYLRLFGLL